MMQLKYFTDAEFRKIGCSLAQMDSHLMQCLDLARDIAGIPFVITSAYRDPAKNAAVGGVGNSAHTRGLAVDISCPDSSCRFKIVDAAIYVGFKRIGIGKNFIHLDVDDSLPHPVIFLYD